MQNYKKPIDQIIMLQNIAKKNLDKNPNKIKYQQAAEEANKVTAAGVLAALAIFKNQISYTPQTSKHQAASGKPTLVPKSKSKVDALFELNEKANVSEDKSAEVSEEEPNELSLNQKMKDLKENKCEALEKNFDPANANLPDESNQNSPFQNMQKLLYNCNNPSSPENIDGGFAPIESLGQDNNLFRHNDDHQ